MKKIYLLLGFAMFLFVACNSGDKSNDESSESNEPNNKIEEATSIDLGKEYNLTINPKEDIDWFKVEVTEQGYLQVLIKGAPEDLDVQARFAKYDEWGDETEDFITGFVKAPSTIQIVEPGTYYVLLADRWNENTSETEFTLKVDFIKEFDDFEPNIDPQSANVIAFGEEYKSAIFPIGDQDWFKFTVEEQGYVEIKSKTNDEDVKLSVHFATFDEYRADPIEIIKSKDKLPQVIAVTELGEYYLCLADRWDSEQSQTVFDWVVDFIPEFDLAEPNNSELDVTVEILGNETLNLAIFPLGDLDMYKFVPAKSGMLNIKGKDFGDIEPYAVLYKIDEGNELVEMSNVTIPGDLEIPEGSIEYYVCIKDRWDSNSAPELFELVFSF